MDAARSATLVYTNGGNPMAPLPPSSTARVFYDYSQGPVQHTLMVRVTEAAAQADIDANVEAFLNAIAPILVASTITGVRRAELGSDVTLPITSAIQGDTFGAGAGDISSSARQISFTGRSPGGRKARVSMFGLNFAPTDYRFSGGENGAARDAWESLGTDADVFIGIDGLSPVLWHQYANVGLNDHYVKEAR